MSLQLDRNYLKSITLSSPEPFENSTEKSLRAVRKPLTKSWLNSMLPYFLWIRQILESGEAPQICQYADGSGIRYVRFSLISLFSFQNPTISFIIIHFFFKTFFNILYYKLMIKILIWTYNNNLNIYNFCLNTGVVLYKKTKKDY